MNDDAPRDNLALAREKIARLSFETLKSPDPDKRAAGRFLRDVLPALLTWLAAEDRQLDGKMSDLMFRLSDNIGMAVALLVTGQSNREELAIDMMAINILSSARFYGDHPSADYGNVRHLLDELENAQRSAYRKAAQ